MTTSRHNDLKQALNSAGQSKTTKPSIDNNDTYKNIKSREGKKMIAGYFSSEVHKNLKIIAAQNDISIQDIVHEAIINYLDAKGYNKT
jgi:predicted HicB family RNase H-like nuclease